MTRAPALLLASLLLAPPLRGADLPLSENGKATAVVVVGSDDPWQKEGRGKPGRALTSAQVGGALAALLEKACGAKFEVLREADLGAVAVAEGRLSPASPPAGRTTYLLVGEGGLTRKLGATLEGLGPGGVVVRTYPNAVAILGRNDLSLSGGGGTGYAVFQFLEALGFRDLWPGETGLVVPKGRSLAAPKLDLRFTPPIGQRRIRFMPCGPRRFDVGLQRLGMKQEDYVAAVRSASDPRAPASWEDWMCLGGNLGITGGHAGYGLKGGWEEHGKAHPEWFALQADGTRGQSGAKERWRACISNPALVEHVAKGILEDANANPEQRCFSLAPNDGGTSSDCLCPECRKLDPPDAPKIQLPIFDKVGDARRKMVESPSLTDRHVHYWNAVAEKVCKARPDLFLTVDAYAGYSTPPVREKLHPNLVLRYVPSDLEGWRGWQAAGAKRIFWRPNNLHSGYQTAVLSIKARGLVENSRAFAAGGMLATDVQGIYDNWSTQGLNYYALARSFWNPSLTYEQILDDYCRSGFGPAAAPIKKYFLRAEEIYDSTAPPPATDGAEPQRPALPRPIAGLTPAAIAELRGLLRQAWTAASADEACRKRVAFLAAGLDHTAATAEIYRRSVENPAREPAAMADRWAAMKARFAKQPLAVNVALVAGFDDLLLRVFGDPGQAAAAPKAAEGPDWLFEDQTPARK
jgi:hypothetical protein